MTPPRLAGTGLGIGLLSLLLLPVALFTPLVAAVPLIGAGLGVAAIARSRAAGATSPARAIVAVVLGLVLAAAMVAAYAWIGGPLQALFLGASSSP